MPFADKKFQGERGQKGAVDLVSLSLALSADIDNTQHTPAGVFCRAEKRIGTQLAQLLSSLRKQV